MPSTQHSNAVPRLRLFQGLKAQLHFNTLRGPFGKLRAGSEGPLFHNAARYLSAAPDAGSDTSKAAIPGAETKRSRRSEPVVDRR